jgi:D-glycero-D-manno-heptose 1,7-bisphosphate phosphatase
MKIQGVFIDRDGTINVERGYVYRTEDFEYIPGALEALRLVSERKIKIYIVTNQAGIAKGIYTENDFQILTKDMLDYMARHGIEIADVLYCPHHPEGTVAVYRKVCSCRKPEPGLLEAVIRKEGFSEDRLALIGDKNSDIEAGRKLGIRTYLVETGYGMHHKHTTRADYVVRDIEEAVRHLL